LQEDDLQGCQFLTTRSAALNQAIALPYREPSPFSLLGGGKPLNHTTQTSRKGGKTALKDKETKQSATLNNKGEAKTQKKKINKKRPSVAEARPCRMKPEKNKKILGWRSLLLSSSFSFSSISQAPT
jgi:hypothetical protein